MTKDICCCGEVHVEGESVPMGGLQFALTIIESEAPMDLMKEMDECNAAWCPRLIITREGAVVIPWIEIEPRQRHMISIAAARRLVVAALELQIEDDEFDQSAALIDKALELLTERDNG